jgi:hypothetical protein
LIKEKNADAWESKKRLSSRALNPTKPNLGWNFFLDSKEKKERS